ncbi:MAG: hypothetical protein ACJ75E_21760, partial [Actinomycetes bacterium]
MGEVGAVVDDDVHPIHRRQRGDRQGEDGDQGEAFGGDRHLGVGAGLVELDHAFQVADLAVGHPGDPGELVLE